MLKRVLNYNLNNFLNIRILKNAKNAKNYIKIRTFTTSTNISKKDPLYPYIDAVNENNLELIHNSIINLKRNEKFEIIEMLYDYMLFKGLTPLYKTLGIVMITLGDNGYYSRSFEIFNSLLLQPTFPGPVLCSSFLRIALENNEYDDLDRLFLIIKEQYPDNISIYLPYILGLHERNLSDKLLEVYNDIKSKNIALNNVLFSTFLTGFYGNKMYNDVIDVWKYNIKHVGGTNNSHFYLYISSLCNESKHPMVLSEMMNAIDNRQTLVNISDISSVIESSYYCNTNKLFKPYLKSIIENTNFEIKLNNIGEMLYCYAKTNAKEECDKYIKYSFKYLDYLPVKSIRYILYSSYILDNRMIFESIKRFLSLKNEIFGTELNLLLKELVKLNKFELLDDIYVYINSNDDIIFKNPNSLSYILYSWSKLGKYNLIDKTINIYKDLNISSFQYNSVLGTIHYNKNEKEKALNYYKRAIINNINNNKIIIDDKLINNMLQTCKDLNDKNSYSLISKKYLDLPYLYNKDVVNNIYNDISNEFKDNNEFINILNMKNDKIKLVDENIKTLDNFEKLCSEKQIYINTSEAL